jgi:hypothetical protein
MTPSDRVRALVSAGALVGAACALSPGAGPSDVPTSASSPSPLPTPQVTPTPTPAPTPLATPSATPTPNPGLSYDQDLKRVFDSDCIGCHRAANPIAGYSMTTYAAVIRDVRPGDPNCTLVKITRAGDAMYQNFSGDRDAKAALVYDWVVKYGAAQSR